MASFAALRLPSASLLVAACLCHVQGARIDISSLKRLADGSSNSKATYIKTETDAGRCANRAYYTRCAADGLKIDNDAAERNQNRYKALEATCQKRWTTSDPGDRNYFSPCRWERKWPAGMPPRIQRLRPYASWFECVPDGGYKCGSRDTEEVISMTSQLTKNAAVSCQATLCAFAKHGTWYGATKQQHAQAKGKDWPEKTAKTSFFSWGWSHTISKKCQKYVNGVKIIDRQDYDSLSKRGWIKKERGAWIFNKDVCTPNPPAGNTIVASEGPIKEPSVRKTSV